MNTTLVLMVLTGFTAAAQQPLHVGFLQPTDSKVVGPHHAAALAFAEKSGRVTQMSPAPDNGWQDATRHAARTRRV